MFVGSFLGLVHVILVLVQVDHDDILAVAPIVRTLIGTTIFHAVLFAVRARSRSRERRSFIAMVLATVIPAALVIFGLLVAVIVLAA